MHRIDAPGHVNNTFTEGNPSQGVAATQVSADILNALQEELCAVIAGSGIALNKADNGQLLAALLARFATLAALNAHTGASAPHSGHATTSALAAHADLTLPHSATSAAIASRIMSRNSDGRVEAVAGVAGNQLVNFSQFAALKAINGYRIAPDGILEQWGVVGPISNDANLAVAFPTPFPTLCASVKLTGYAPVAVNNTPQLVSVNAAGLTVRNKSFESVGWGNLTVYYEVKGW